MNVNFSKEHIPNGTELIILKQDSIIKPENPKDKRKLEYQLSRKACQQAFQNKGLDFKFDPNQIRTNPDLPAGWLCSISHSWPYASALIAPSDTYSHIGHDIEDLSKQVTRRVITRISTDQELEWLSIQDQNTRAISLFSAKESIYKAFSKEIEKFSYKKIKLNYETNFFKAEVENRKNLEVYAYNYKQTHLLTFLTIPTN